jgi:hypothetical protein
MFRERSFDLENRLADYPCVAMARAATIFSDGHALDYVPLIVRADDSVVQTPGTASPCGRR